MFGATGWEDEVADFLFETRVSDGHRMADWQRERTAPNEPDYRPRGTYFCLYLTGESGSRYHSQRAFDDSRPGKSTRFMFVRVRDGDRQREPENLWDDVAENWHHENFSYEERPDKLLWSTDTCPRVEVREDGWDWVDAGGRWNLSAKPLGDRGYYFHVPVQPGFDIPHYHQGQCYWAEGTVGGEKVRGYGYLERAWSSGGEGIPFMKLPLVRNMNKLWMHFYAAFEDGGYVTGCARKGRLGVNWSMAYVVNDGVAKVITPTATDIAYSEDGLVERVRLNTGEQVLEFEHDAVLYKPIHTVGRMTRVIDRAGKGARDRGRITDSWTVTEWWPDNAPEALDWMAEEAAKGSEGVHLLDRLPIVGEYMPVPE